MKTHNIASPFSDIREETFASRVEIGFSPREVWHSAPAVFDDHTLTIEGHPVMEDWEDSYMRELAAIAGSRGGSVLEVGFGMGISAGYIQKHTPERHIIIEANKEVFEKLREFGAAARAPVLPLLGFWQDVLRDSVESGSISGILFDTYPLTEDEIHRNHFPFFKEAYRVLEPGGVLTYYSDEMEDFSPAHLEALRGAGFENIDKKICSVTPPLDCAYWKSGTIVAPIITK